MLEDALYLTSETTPIQHKIRLRRCGLANGPHLCLAIPPASFVLCPLLPCRPISFVF